MAREIRQIPNPKSPTGSMLRRLQYHELLYESMVLMVTVINYYGTLSEVYHYLLIIIMIISVPLLITVILMVHLLLICLLLSLNKSMDGNLETVLGAFRRRWWKTPNNCWRWWCTCWSQVWIGPIGHPATPGFSPMKTHHRCCNGGCYMNSRSGKINAGSRLEHPIGTYWHWNAY